MSLFIAKAAGFQKLRAPNRLRWSVGRAPLFLMILVHLLLAHSCVLAVQSAGGGRTKENAASFPADGSNTTQVVIPESNSSPTWSWTSFLTHLGFGFPSVSPPLDLSPGNESNSTRGPHGMLRSKKTPSGYVAAAANFFEWLASLFVHGLYSDEPDEAQLVVTSNKTYVGGRGEGHGGKKPPGSASMEDSRSHNPQDHGIVEDHMLSSRSSTTSGTLSPPDRIEHDELYGVSGQLEYNSVDKDDGAATRRSADGRTVISSFLEEEHIETNMVISNLDVERERHSAGNFPAHDLVPGETSPDPASVPSATAQISPATAPTAGRPMQPRPPDDLRVALQLYEKCAVAWPLDPELEVVQGDRNETAASTATASRRKTRRLVSVSPPSGEGEGASTSWVCACEGGDVEAQAASGISPGTTSSGDINISTCRGIPMIYKIDKKKTGGWKNRGVEIVTKFQHHVSPAVGAGEMIEVSSTFCKHFLNYEQNKDYKLNKWECALTAAAAQKGVLNSLMLNDFLSSATSFRRSEGAFCCMAPAVPQMSQDTGEDIAELTCGALDARGAILDSARKSQDGVPLRAVTNGHDLASILRVETLPERFSAGKYHEESTLEGGPFAVCLPSGESSAEEFFNDVIGYHWSDEADSDPNTAPTEDDVAAVADGKMDPIIQLLTAMVDNLRDVGDTSESTLKRFAETHAFHRNVMSRSVLVRHVNNKIRLAVVDYAASCCPRSRMAVDACSTGEKSERIVKVCSELTKAEAGKFEPAGTWDYWSPDHFTLSPLMSSKPSLFNAERGDRFSWAIMTVSAILSVCGWVPAHTDIERHARSTLLFGFGEDPDRGPAESYPSKDNYHKLMAVQTEDGAPGGAVWKKSDTNGDGVALLNKLASTIERKGDDEQEQELLGEVARREIMARCSKFGKKMHADYWGKKRTERLNVEKITAAIDAAMSIVMDGESGWAAVAKGLLGIAPGERIDVAGGSGTGSAKVKKWPTRYMWGTLSPDPMSLLDGHATNSETALTVSAVSTSGTQPDTNSTQDENTGSQATSGTVHGDLDDDLRVALQLYERCAENWPGDDRSDTPSSRLARLVWVLPPSENDGAEQVAVDVVDSRRESIHSSGTTTISWLCACEGGPVTADGPSSALYKNTTGPSESFHCRGTTSIYKVKSQEWSSMRIRGASGLSGVEKVKKFTHVEEGPSSCGGSSAE
ncbi:unnamed protein product [Amoebophrya sp. A120]|nr:unnamed protein product [Amoebophrya sp. A120]|eukprot:GSA120T00006162001.1